MIATLARMAPDPTLPSRDRLLDAEFMAARLGEILSRSETVEVDGYERGRVKYRVGASLRVLHRCRIDGRPVLVASRTFPAGESNRAYEAALDSAPGEPSEVVAHDPELDTVFWVFPHDRKLATLPLLLGRSDELDRLVGVPVIPSVVQYAPEKSATAACRPATGGEPLAYAKVYADADEGRLGHLIHDHLPRVLNPTHPNLGLPGFLGYDAPSRLLVVEAVRGVRMDLLQGEALIGALGELGRAVATLHGLRPPAGIPRFSRLTPERAGTAAGFIGRLLPDLAADVAELAAELIATYTEPSEPDACLHGDVHPKNAILRDGRVVLIDMDQLALGPSAAELGSVRAALRYRAVTGQARRGEIARLEAAFLNGFGATRSLPSGTEIRWYTAAALLNERALRAVNRMRPEGLAVMDALLAEARSELRGGA